MTDSTEQPSEKYYFISYSRQEVTFVDSLSHALEKLGISTWVDFRNLVPGKKWQIQLDEGVKNSTAILLVVSKESMKSGPVMDEVEKSIAAGRRIIMILFEPCKINEKLKGREWIDFTGDFNIAILQLKSLLAQPEGKMPTPPEQYEKMKVSPLSFLRALTSPVAIITFLVITFLRFIFGGGFLPRGVKRFFFLSVLVTILSFGAVFSGTATGNSGADNILAGISIAAIPFIYIPAAWNFLQFPVRVRYRTHNAEKLRNSIIGLFVINLLPVLIDIGAFLGVPGLKGDVAAFLLALVTLSGSYYLYRVLTSDAFYRWAGPAGALVSAPQPDLTKHLNTQPIDKQVAIEFAPQDASYARELKDSVLKAGYKITENLQEADIVLTLLSAYQNKSQCDPETKYVVPILLQSFKEIDDGDKNEFSKVQWIDLRHGKASMDAVANLLDEPEDLQRVLGIIPMRIPILPNGVNYLASLLSFTLTYSAIWTFMQVFTKLTPDTTTGIKQGLAIADYLGVLFVAGLFLFRRYILKRRAWLIQSRVKIFYKTHNFGPIIRKLIASMEKRNLFVDFEKRINDRLGKIEFSYPLVLGFAMVLAVLATVAYLEVFILFLPIWLIPALMLLKPVKLWLPAKAK